MKALSTFDLHLWNLYVPRLNEERFKNRLLCVLALCYIAIYRLPRKFLIHYFRGNGKDMVIDSSGLVMNNRVVLNKLSEAITAFNKHGVTDGSFSICQTDVLDPNYKYAIGSFTVNYSIRHRAIEMTINAGYHYQPNPNRLTRHLHSWLYSMTEKGSAKSFQVRSFPLIKTFSEVAHARASVRPQKLPKHVYLV